MNEAPTMPSRQQQAIDRTLHNIRFAMNDILVDAPTFTGKIEIHLKDGVALDLTTTRRIKIIE
jgi:hypothetical protein